MNEPNIQEMLDQYVNVPTHFAFNNGITVSQVDQNSATGALEVSEKSLNPGKTVHGGALLTLADTVAGSFVAGNSPANCVTSSCSMEFLRPAYGPTITCVATPKKLGRAISVVAVSLSDVAGKVVATGTYSFCMVKEVGTPL